MSENGNRPSVYKLWCSLREAKDLFPIHSEWEHYSGDVYEITGHGIDEATGQPEVRYTRATPLNDGRQELLVCVIGESSQDYIRQIEFHRSVAEFAATVSDGPRFQRVRRVEFFERGA